MPWKKKFMLKKCDIMHNVTPCKLVYYKFYLSTTKYCVYFCHPRYPWPALGVRVLLGFKNSNPNPNPSQPVTFTRGFFKPVTIPICIAARGGMVWEWQLRLFLSRCWDLDRRLTPCASQSPLVTIHWTCVNLCFKLDEFRPWPIGLWPVTAELIKMVIGTVLRLPSGTKKER